MARVGFGVRLPVAGPLASPSAISETARRAEDLDYDALWVHDYIVWTKELDRTHVSCGAAELIREDQEPLFFESLTTLAFVAGVTRRIRLGTAILCVPYRNPIVTAKQLANLDVLSGGRLTLGVGVGARKSTHNQDFEVLGVPRADKYERTADYLRAMRTIWTEARPAYSGPFINFPETEIFPKPVQRPHPPIWFGGSGPSTIALLAEFGSGWLPTWLTPDAYRTRIAEVRQALTESGRGDTALEVGDEIVTCIASTDEEAEARSRRTVETLSSGFTVRSAADASASALIGSPHSVRDKAKALADAGVTHFELKFIYRSLDEFDEELELLAREVLPAFH